jgi:ABC-type branched-subunit amino acid transport system permease subunit
MNKFFIIGAVTAWLLLRIVSGKLWPVLSLPTILVVTIGGVVGVLLGLVLSRARRK